MQGDGKWLGAVIACAAACGGTVSTGGNAAPGLDSGASSGSDSSGGSGSGGGSEAGGDGSEVAGADGGEGGVHASGTLVSLAAGVHRPIGIAVDATDVYWTDHAGGTVTRCRHDVGTR